MDEITFKEFQKLDMRIGQIVSAEKIEGSENLLVLQVDLGSEKRQIVSGLAKYAEPQQLINKKIVILTNLEPKRFMGVESRGMLLAADVDGKPLLLTVDGDAPPGSKVT